MPLDLTPDQLNQLQELGITVSKSTTNISEEIKDTQVSSPTTGQILHQTISSTHSIRLLPLLSLSGLTLLSFGGIILFKNKESAPPTPYTTYNTPHSDPTPTQVPKSIQHYLLTSQQFFTQALSAQTSQPALTPDLLNQSLLAATEAIKEFPSDYRGYDQRGRIYASLIQSQPTLLTNAIADLSTASRLNPASAEITHSLATLYAKKGDIPNTLSYLSQTINLEPTKAQNFYDLARLQTQAGYIPQALETYTRLLTLIADPVQQQQVASEKASLEKLLSQNKGVIPSVPSSIPQNQFPTPQTEGPLLEANSSGGLVIAAPETSKDISISNLTNSNALAGSSTLPANTPSITLTNSQLLTTSKVYVSITKGGKNQALRVLSRTANSFSIGLDTAIPESIDFKWWIVNP